jgi:antitoxin PrlF
MFLHQGIVGVPVMGRNAGHEEPIYSGSKTKAGNSDALRFEKVLFRSHPEFSGQVKAQVIAPGYMLVIAERMESADDDDDPVIGIFLALLEKDVPSQIQALDSDLFDRLDDLAGYIDVEFDERLFEKCLTSCTSPLNPPFWGTLSVI